MHVGQKNWQAFKDKIAQAYMRYQIYQKTPMPMDMTLQKNLRMKQIPM